MQPQYEYTKARLMAEIDRELPALNATLDALTDDQLQRTDAAGWRISDHVANLAAWERSVLVLLGGRPRYEGLGISEALYESHDVDAVNDAIFQRERHLTFAQARELFTTTHEELLAALAPLSDADLNGSVDSFLPAASGDDRPVIGALYANTAAHYAEHHQWIRALAGQDVS